MLDIRYYPGYANSVQGALSHCQLPPNPYPMPLKQVEPSVLYPSSTVLEPSCLFNIYHGQQSVDRDLIQLWQCAELQY